MGVANTDGDGSSQQQPLLGLSAQQIQNSVTSITKHIQEAVALYAAYQVAHQGLKQNAAPGANPADLVSKYFDSFKDPQSATDSGLSKEEVIKRAEHLKQTTILIGLIANYKQSLSTAELIYEKQNNGHRCPIMTRQIAVAEQMAAFINVLLAEGSFDEKHFDLATRLTLALQSFAATPLDLKKIAALKALDDELNSLLETDSYAHAIHTGIRFLSGAVTALLGVALMWFSLFSPILNFSLFSPLLVTTLATAAFTSFYLGWEQPHWGLLTFGKQTFDYGYNWASAGPSLFQGKFAAQLSKDINAVIVSAEDKIAEGAKLN